MVTKPTPAEIEAYAAQRLNELGIAPPNPDVSNLAFHEEKYRLAKKRHLENAELFLNRRYELERTRETEQADRDRQHLDVLTEELRAGYLAVPGATEVAFQADLPDLLADRRRQAARTADADKRAQLERARASGRYSV